MMSAVAFVLGCWTVTVVVYFVWRSTIRQPAWPLPGNPGPTEVEADRADRFPYE